MPFVMTDAQSRIIWSLLIGSVGFLVLPVIVWIVRRIISAFSGVELQKAAVSKILMFSAFLIGSVWCLRYAVGYYEIISAGETDMTLEWWEEIFNSLVHTLQTFSMDEGYTEYILSGKEMLGSITNADPIWQTIYGAYASVLNFISPIAGGAIIFEILASVFPRIKLKLSYLAFWKEKYYFSKLNQASLALAKSVFAANSSWLRKPIVVFSDVHGDDCDESSYEMQTEAKLMGAICIRDDLSHVAKNKFGRRRFFLINESEIEVLQLLTSLADGNQYKYLKNAEIYLFCRDDKYIQVENQVRDKLMTEYKMTEDQVPVFVPVQSYRNLISNLLVDVPLYEPLVGKKRNADGTVDLTVSILGTGAIGTEMFLSTYWFGQILNCNLKINIVSQEPEADFRGRIDYINPEIRHTTIQKDPVLRINQKGDYSDPYCTVNYVQCDIRSSDFVRNFTADAQDTRLLDTDYFLVALGSDEENLSAANFLRKYMGQHHVESGEAKRTVIAYVIFDSKMADTLNREKNHGYTENGNDLYMLATGSLREVYSARNVFMTEHEALAVKANNAYLSLQDREKRANAHRKRMKDDYKHWASLARAMHVKYKVFSLGLITKTVFDTEGTEDPVYIGALKEAFRQYKQIITCGVEFPSADAKAAHMQLLHEMAWLEHRRWNAFTRVKGFRYSGAYDTYSKVSGSYKQMELKLHPCLVECDKAGIRAVLDETGKVDRSTQFMCQDKEGLDLLDELSYELKEKEMNSYDFKLYDYPLSDFV